MANDYLSNLAAGKTSTGAAASAGNIAWAKAQLAKTPTPAATPAAKTPTPTAGVSASTAKAGSTTALGSTPTPGTAESHQSWINDPKSGQGGMDAYTATANNKYASAVASNNTDMVDKIKTDANRVGFQLTAPAPVSASQVTQTQSGGDAVHTPRSSSDIQQLATDSTAAERAALLNAINTQMGALKNNANYSNQLIKDNRVLEDQSLLRNKNPFSGGTDYQLAQVQRGRSIDDTSRASQLDNTLNSLSTEIADFDKLTPERQRKIYNELLGLERDFGLNVGQLTGTFGGQTTLGGRAQSLAENQFEYGKGQDQIQNDAQYGGTYNGGKTTQQQNQDFNQNLATKQLERSNFESDRDYNFAVGQQDWENNFKTGQFDWQKAQQSWENAFQDKNFEQSMKDAAASRGLQWANLAQNQKEFIANQSFREKEFTYKQGQDTIANDLAASKSGGSTSISSKESANNMNEAKKYVSNLSDDDAIAYIQGISDYLSDADYRSLLSDYQ